MCDDVHGVGVRISVHLLQCVSDGRRWWQSVRRVERQEPYIVSRLELNCGHAASELGVGVVELGVFALEVLKLASYCGVAVQGCEMNGRWLGGSHRISEPPPELHNLGGKVGYLQKTRELLCQPGLG